MAGTPPGPVQAERLPRPRSHRGPIERIIDVDVAAETAQLTKPQILVQAGASMLAQANQGPQIALSQIR